MGNASKMNTDDTLSEIGNKVPTDHREPNPDNPSMDNVAQMPPENLDKPTSEAPDENFLYMIVRTCGSGDPQAAAFFGKPPSITVCSNRVSNKQELAELFNHELTHAYDYV